MAPLTSLQEELAEEERVLRAEQEWFVNTQVQPNLEAIQKSLLACQDAARLQDDAKRALTLAISSTNNDTLKGFVTLASSFIVKGELTIKLPKLPVVKAAIHSHVPSSAPAPASFTTASSTTPTTASSSSSSTTAESSGNQDTEVAVPTGGNDGSKGDSSSAEAHGSSQIQQQDAQIQQPPAATSSVIAVLSGVPQPSQVNTHQLLHSYRPPGHLTQPYFLEQLKDVQNHTDQAIFRLEDYWRCINDARKPDKTTLTPAQKIKESTRALKMLLELMQGHLRAGIQAMAQPRKEKLYPFRVCDPKIFSPALSEDFVIEFYIRDSQLVCAAYALQLTSGATSGPNSGGNTLASYLQQALPGTSSMPVLAPSAPIPTATLSSASDGHTHPSPHHHLSQVPQAAHGYHPSGLSSSFAANTAIQISGGNHDGVKSGSATPRLSSPPPRRRAASVQNYHQHSSSQQGAGKSYSWLPSRPPTTNHHPGAEHHPSSSLVTNPPLNESVVLPSSSKIGQTSKGGINKYRDKIATTIEDKVVQVQSPKLEEIRECLVHAENLCRRLLHFLVLQESVDGRNAEHSQ
ncbi:hypothetical protein BG011_005773 [Mortierella polycephala]|uniref:Uncharacterized protein n=1 Tax=Mortierella polycephala TaxID=41804 RepID=A0A9P6TZY1_9FUNG|nr:hypothetical protein BG011_005773 [Mortierella polycephala]